MKKIISPLLVLATSSVFAFREIPDYENTQNLVTQQEITSVIQMQNLGLNSGATAIEIWSGSYWPQYEGSLGVRYRDPSIQALMSNPKAQYKDFRAATAARPLYSVDTNSLSPAEKYDLLVGDEKMSLTTYSWDIGFKNGGEYGKVPTWRGICDGFSSAAQMMPRPRKSVTMTSPSGIKITFFPEDIKALGSLSYARSQRDTIFLGKRCVSSLLFFAGACGGTNPGALHKALANRVGAMKKSFVADIDPSSEVWNYPIKSYSFKYYNVLTNEDADDVRDAVEYFDKKKKFRKKDSRHKNTSYIVGVTAVVNYGDMRDANLLTTDSAENDKTLTRTYDYDLELDANFNILGGEPSGKTLPDFIWAPNDGTYPLSEPERKGLPRSAAELVQKAQEAGPLGQPLAVIVRQLFEASR